jgi:hypothetical protein
VDDAEVRSWFAGYLDLFAAVGRGEREVDSLLAFYGVPLLYSGNEGYVALTSADDVRAAAQKEVDGMRAGRYDHSELLAAEVAPVNASSALFEGRFSRRRADASEINQLAVMYLITEGRAGRRISVLAVHGS